VFIINIKYTSKKPLKVVKNVLIINFTCGGIIGGGGRMTIGGGTLKIGGGGLDTCNQFKETGI